MSTVAEQIKRPFAQSAVLLDALDAVRHKRALVALALTFLAFALALVALGGVSAWLSVKSATVGGLLFLFSALIWAGIILLGITAVGILLSDDVWAREPRTVSEALAAAAASVHRLVIVMLLAGAAVLVYLAVLALALWLCKLPGLGPLLYAIVFPVATLASGLLIFSLGYVVLPLAAPCVWNGDNVAQVIATLKEVLRNRLLYVFVMFLLLGLAVLTVAGIAGVIVFSGTGLTVSMSLAVVGFGGGFDFGGPAVALGGNATGGYGAAFGFGMTVLMLAGAMPATLIGIKGAALIHKDAIADLAVDEAAAELQRRLDEVRQRAQEARQRALAPKPAPAPKPRLCPNAHCGAPVDPDDAFCIECGEKLK